MSLHGDEILWTVVTGLCFWRVYFAEEETRENAQTGGFCYELPF